MWKFAASIIQRFSGLTPMKAFLKYIFQRISNDFLDHEPNIDFKKGELELNDLPLSANKINQTFLMSSPYIMHSGVIRKLKIILPNITEITSKSIEFQVSGLELVFYPNKYFVDRFNDQMKQIKDNSKFYDVQDNVRNIDFKQDDSLDFFKQIIKQILTNIKVNISNINIKVFMNTPSQSKSNPKPQFYSMLRIPSIIVQRNKSQQHSASDQIQKYMLTIPQISTHLLREDQKFPEYSNIKSTQQDFPYSQPSINHPSTLMLIGNKNLQQSQSQSVIFYLSIKQQLQTKIKKYSIKATIPNIQFMIEPYQIKVLQKFTSQLNQFKKLYQYSMQQLRKQDTQLFQKISNVSRDFSIKQSMRMTIDLHASMDIFSSIAMAWQQPKQLKRFNYFDSIMQQTNKGMNQLKTNLGEFSKQIDKQAKDKIKQKMNTKFNTVVKTNIDIGFIRLYLLKHNSSNTLIDYQRVWTSYRSNNKGKLINQNIPTSYFLFNIKHIGIESSDKEMVMIRAKKIIMLNVKLTENKIGEESYVESNDLFYSVNTMHQQSLHKSLKMSVGKSNKTKSQSIKSLVRFEKSHHQHYCASYIFWISLKDSSKVKKKQSNYIRCINSQPAQQQIDIFSVGLSIKLTKPGTKQSKTSIIIQKIGVLFDLQIAKDIINIIFPLFTYRNLINSINLKKQEINTTTILEQPNNSKQFMKSNLAYSRYDLAVSPQFIEQQPISNNNNNKNKKNGKIKQLLEIDVSSISITFCNSFVQTDLVSNEKKKVSDYDSFDCNCFCQYHSQSICLEVNSFKIRSDLRQKIYFNSLSVFLSSLQSLSSLPLSTLPSSSHHPSSSRILILHLPSKNCIFIQSLQPSSLTQQKITINIPSFKINIQKTQCSKIIQTLSTIGQSYKQLKIYFQYLKTEFKKMNTTTIQHNKNKKPLVTQIVQTNIILHLENFEISLFDIEIFVKNLVLLLETKQTMMKMNNVTVVHRLKCEPLLKSVPIGIKTKIKGSEKDIDTSAVMLRIEGEGKEKKEMESFTKDMKDREYFKKLLEYNFNVVIQISQCQEKVEHETKVTDLKTSGKFGFMKRKQLQIISEEQDQKIISITINQSIIIRPCQLKNLIFLKNDISQIESLIQSSKLSQLFQPQSFNKRKDSDWAPQRKTKITLKLKQLCFDIFPYDDLKQSNQILSSTRTYLSLQNVSLQIQNSQKSSDFGQCQNLNTFNVQIKKFDVFFLYFNDSDPFKNLLLLCRQNLLDFGFKKICTFNSLSSNIFYESSLYTKETLIQLIIKIDSIDGQCSSMTTVYLQHHIDTLVRMVDFIKQAIDDNRQKKGISEIKEQNDSDDEAVLIEEEMVKKEEELKSSEQKEFKERTTEFLQVVPEGMVKAMVLKGLEIKRVSFSIFSGDDFDFKESEEKMMIDETILEIGESGIVIREQKQGKQIKRVRYRKTDVDKYTNIRFVVQGIVLEMCKYRHKKGIISDGLNMRSVFKAKTINWISNKMGQDIFYLLKTTQKLSIVFQISGMKIKAKHFLPDYIYAGYTSNLNFLWSQRQQAKNHLMKMAYLIPIQQPQQININFKQTVYQILAFIPKTKLIINLQMIGWKFLNNQQISTLEFFFHGRLSKYMEQDNNKVIMKWITDTLTNNMGSILANTFLGLFSKAIWFFLSCMKHIIIFPGKVFRVLKK